MNKPEILADCFSLLSERLYLYDNQDIQLSNIVKNIFYKQEGIELSHVKTLKSIGFFMNLDSMLVLSYGFSSLIDLEKTLEVFSSMVRDEYFSECINYNTLVEKAQLAITLFKEFDAKKYSSNRISLIKVEILKHRNQLSILNREVLKFLKNNSFGTERNNCDQDATVKCGKYTNNNYKQHISKLKNERSELRANVLKKINKLKDWTFHLNSLRSAKKELRNINLEVCQKRKVLWASISVLLSEYLNDLKIQKISKNFIRHLESYVQLKKPLSLTDFNQSLPDFCNAIDMLVNRGDLNLIKVVLNKFCYLKFTRNVFLENNKYMGNLLEKFYYNRDIPPICHTKLSQYKNSLIPDCGESTLRNMINILIWDKKKACFNVNKLIRLFPNIKNEIIDFYQRFNSFESVLSQTAHNEWMSVCSSIDGVKYLFPPCNPNVEIAPGFYNFKNIICSMFGVQELDDFIKLLKPPSLKITIEDSNELKKIIMELEASSVEILFIERHFRTFEREQSLKSTWEAKKNFLLEMKSTAQFSYELFISCCLFVEGHELPEVMDTIASIFMCNRTCLIIFLCSRLDLIESREIFCSTILESPRFKYDVYGHNIIRAITNSMPENQDHHDKKIRVLNLLSRIRKELGLVHEND
ncbi:hypothetical protein [Legionella anisa]|uniref:hypothetical protein n=1 Tax=Legionella anisa TaxID=28082 RepID=UPI0010417840|nr:hypothetical protein [Legionella anisa]